MDGAMTTIFDPAAYPTQHDVVEALAGRIRCSWSLAQLTAAFLDNWFDRLERKRQPKLPAGFLLELGAIIRIYLWQRSGVAAWLELPFQDAEILLEKLLDRLRTDPASFYADAPSASNTLFAAVMDTAWRHRAWSSFSELGADIAIPSPSPVIPIDAIVELLWSSRHLLKEAKSNDQPN